MMITERMVDGELVTLRILDHPVHPREQRRVEAHIHLGVFFRKNRDDLVAIAEKLNLASRYTTSDEVARRIADHIGATCAAAIVRPVKIERSKRLTGKQRRKNSNRRISGLPPAVEPRMVKVDGYELVNPQEVLFFFDDDDSAVMARLLHG